jgi:DNA-binding NarL/FixJ family response regulator
VLSALHPAIKLVALADTATDARFTAAARRAGVAAVLSPHQHVADVIRTLHRVRVGERPFAAARPTAIVHPLRRPKQPPAASVLDRLTLREQEVLMLIADGHATIEIAQTLAISLHTARTHVQSVLTKLGAHSRLEASGMMHGVACNAPPSYSL